jgi:uncharacterized YccA/Bax inhibitor family protein
MANPFLNDKAMAQASSAGWAAPEPSTRVGRSTPIDDGPVTSWAPRTMTVNGTITATGVMMVLLLASATVGWMASPTYENGGGLPMLAIVGILVGFVCAIAVHFKPLMAKFLGPIYAVAEGFFVGAISKAYNSAYEGIVIQAVGATLAVFVVMLFLYKTRIIKVTDRFRRTIIMATLGLMLFYMVSFVFSLFGHTPSFINQPTGMGIAFSLFAAGLAAMNLALDFDFIERGAKANLPKGMEWYAAFGLLITLVWLYLEMLRLLSKLNRR